MPRCLLLPIRRHVSAVWLAALGLILLVGCTPPQPVGGDADLPVATRPTGEAVTLVIDFDDGQERRFQLACREKMTVLDALEAAARRQRGITYVHRGSGEMTMIAAIDGLANEGGNGHNWIYRVNGQLADKSCGVYEIRPKDVILWTFGTYEP